MATLSALLRGVEPAGFRCCQNPECDFPANPDPQVSIGYCCEKCEGRANGEEWAFGGKKKHTAYCTSNPGKDASGAGGKKKKPEKCKNPNCWFKVNSDPSISVEFCCEKCEGRFNGEDWAMSGKAHYKNCEKIEADDGGGWSGGVGGSGGGSWNGAGSWSGGSYGLADSRWEGGWNSGKGGWNSGKGGWNSGKGGWDSGKGGWDGPYGPFGNMMQMMMMMMKGKGKGKGDAEAPEQYDAEMEEKLEYDAETEEKLDRWVAAKRSKNFEAADTLRDELRLQGVEPEDARPADYPPSFYQKHQSYSFSKEQKVWVGNVPANMNFEQLKQIMEESGVHPQVVTLGKGGNGQACFETPEEVAEAIVLLNGLQVGEQTLEVDVWT